MKPGLSNISFLYMCNSNCRLAIGNYTARNTDGEGRKGLRTIWVCFVLKGICIVVIADQRDGYMEMQGSEESGSHNWATPDLRLLDHIRPSLAWTGVPMNGWGAR